jgi:nucleoside phosphorylase
MAVSTTDSWHKRIQVSDASLTSVPPRVHVEPIAAGSKVVASTKSHTMRLLADAAPRAVAVELEGTGFLAAVHRFRQSEGLLIRGISDRVDGKTASDKAGWRHQAAANAAAFAFEVMFEYSESDPALGKPLDDQPGDSGCGPE